MSRQLWLISILAGLALAGATGLFIFIDDMFPSGDVVPFIVLLTLCVLFPVSGLYIARKRRIALDYKRSFIASFAALITGFIAIIIYAICVVMRNEPEPGALAVIIAELIVPFLFFLLVAIVISAVVAMFFRYPRTSRESTGALDDPFNDEYHL